MCSIHGKQRRIKGEQHMSDFIPLSSSADAGRGGQRDGGGGGGNGRRNSYNNARGGGGGGGRGGGGRYNNRRGGRGRSDGRHYRSNSPHGARDNHRGQQHQHRNNNRGGGGGHHRARGGGRGRGRFQNTNEIDISGIEEINNTAPSSSPSIRMAVQGCSHGSISEIYSTLLSYHTTKTPSLPKIDILLCCGDFQSVRNHSDLLTMAVPPKYRSLGSFHEYYSGEKVAPFLTIFVGGNHEASGYLQELYYGGWVAPNIYYLGVAGCVNVVKGSRRITIGGISGIYKSFDYNKGHFEQPPYTPNTLRSVYHVRQLNVYRMSLLSSPKIDVMLSHDWPRGIEQYGDVRRLLSQKKYFRKEVEENNLGSPACERLLYELKPKWWFAAHLHVKFFAQVCHETKKEESVKEGVGLLVPSQVKQLLKNDAKQTMMEMSTNKDDATQTINEHDNSAATSSSSSGTQTINDEHDSRISQKEDETNSNSKNDATTTTSFLGLESTCQENDVQDLTQQMTQFLSLDKCLPRRKHLQIVNLPLHHDGNNDCNMWIKKQEKDDESDVKEESKDEKVSSTMIDVVEGDGEKVTDRNNNDNTQEDSTPSRSEQEQITSKKQPPSSDDDNHHQSPANTPQYNCTPQVHLEYDLEWLTILQKTHDLTSSKNQKVILPRHAHAITTQDMTKVYQQFQKHLQIQHPEGNNPFKIPCNFVMTVPPPPPNDNEEGNGKKENDANGGKMVGNPQTDELLDILGLHHIVTVPYQRDVLAKKDEVEDGKMIVGNEIMQLDGDNDDDDDGNNENYDCNEIDLDGDDHDEDIIEEEDGGNENGKNNETCEIEDDNEINVDDEDEEEDELSKLKDISVEEVEDEENEGCSGGNISDHMQLKKRPRTGSIPNHSS